MMMIIIYRQKGAQWRFSFASGTVVMTDTTFGSVLVAVESVVQDDDSFRSASNWPTPNNCFPLSTKMIPAPDPTAANSSSVVPIHENAHSALPGIVTRHLLKIARIDFSLSNPLENARRSHSPARCSTPRKPNCARRTTTVTTTTITWENAVTRLLLVLRHCYHILAPRSCRTSHKVRQTPISLRNLLIIALQSALKRLYQAVWHHLLLFLW